MYYFIINPKAQSGRGAAVWKKIRRVLKKKHIAYEVLFTEKTGHASELVRKAAQKGDENKTVVVMGGDGTISEAMDGLWDRPDVTFAYIPIGSGNDFARTLGISSSWRKALKGILNKEHEIMLHPGRLEINGEVHHFGGSMGIGFDAAVCYDVENLRFKSVFNRLGLGRFTYLGIALKLLITSLCDPMKIRLDGKDVHSFSKVLFLCALKGKYEGGGFMFTPQARMDDPYLHICVAHGIPVLKRFFLLPKCLKGKHVGSPGVSIYRCRKIEILSSRPKFLHVDGELVGPAKKAVVRLEETKIRMVY